MSGAAPETIVFPPSIGWDVHLVQRPHHLARAFARRGHRVLFDDSNGLDGAAGDREVAPGLFVCRTPSPALDSAEDPVLWSFPYNVADALDRPNPRRVVYDWIDDLSVFPGDPEILGRAHERALREADVVVSVARRLHESALAVRPDALYLPNGVDPSHFGRPGPTPADAFALSPSARRPIAGYYGAIASWFDAALLEDVARRLPGWDFLLIGPFYHWALEPWGLLNRPNVRWLGPREYAELPGYLAAFDVAIIPFVVNEITLATSPLKLFEFFAGGKPVVSTPLPECEAFPEVRIASDAAGFARAVVEAAEWGKRPRSREALLAIADANSWDARVERALARLRQPRGAPYGSA